MPTIRILTPQPPDAPPVLRSTDTCPATLWPTRAIEVATTILRLQLRDAFGDDVDRVIARRIATIMLDAAEKVRLES